MAEMNPTAGEAEDEDLDLEGVESFEIAQRARPALDNDPAKKGFWKKLKRGLFMTHTEIIERVDASMAGRGVLDEETLEYLEEGLIAADLGVETALEVVDQIRTKVAPKDVKNAQRLHELLAEEIAGMLLEGPKGEPLSDDPAVIMMVGVNGVGKTTSIAKLARYEQQRGRRVLLAAGDTFRAAAIEQLTLWSERTGTDIIKQKAGGDPAAVVFDAIQAAKARKVDRVIVDTAGRLHTKSHLMAELEKVGRVLDREAQGWQRRTLLVLDSTTGQNAISQAKEFARSVPVDGVFLTKLDGTAKGGVAVAVARDLKLPIFYLGVGEGADDIVRFDAQEFAAALFDAGSGED